ncbi:MAG: aminotransferase class I/II-fold pyridoxal phosphate-dependent enzyme [Pseudomonadota bacterium]
MPRYSPRADWIKGDGASAWDIHFRAYQDSKTDPSVLMMSVGDPDFDTPPAIVERAVEALRGGDTHYAEINGRTALRAAIADYINTVSGAELYQADNLTVLAGTQNALYTAAQLLLAPGDEVISLDPMYVTYEALLKSTGAELVRVPNSADDGFRPNVSGIAAAVTPRTKLIAFSNPNNPTGVVMTRNELEAIADIARKHDLWVLSDEVYGALTFESDHISIASLPGMAERTATVGSLSKSHAMTGWRTGWLAGPTELAEHADNLALCMLYGLPGFIQEAAIVALQQAGAAADEMREIYRKRRDLVVELLNGTPQIEVLAPESGMFVLLGVRGAGLDAEQFTKELYEAEKVSLLNGGAFGPNAAGFARLSFTGNEEQIREGCARIRRFAEGLARKSVA